MNESSSSTTFNRNNSYWSYESNSDQRPLCVMTEGLTEICNPPKLWDDEANVIMYQQMLLNDPQNKQAFYDIGLILIKQGKLIDGFRFLYRAFKPQCTADEVTAAVREVIQDNKIYQDKIQELIRNKQCFDYASTLPRCVKEILLQPTYFTKLFRSNLIENYLRQTDLKVDIGIGMEEDLLLGRAFLDRKDYDKALFIFKFASARYQPCVEGLLYQGITLHYQHKFNEAKLKFKEARDLDLGNTDALFYYGIMLFGERNYQEAQEVFNELLIIDPINLNAKELLQIIQNNNNRRLRIIEKDQDCPYYSFVNFVNGKILLEKNDLQQAVSVLEKASQTSPEYSAFHWYLACALFLKGDFDTATLKLGRAIKNHPKCWQFFAALGQLLKQSDQNRDLEEAIRAFKKVSKLNPKYRDIYLDWGEVLVKQKNFKAARHFFRKTQTAEGYRLSGETFITQKEYNKAISQFKISDSLEPPNCETYILWGSALSEQEDKTDEAILKFKRAAEIDPTNSDAYYRWARALLKQNRGQEAMEMLQKSENLKNPSDISGRSSRLFSGTSNSSSRYILESCNNGSNSIQSRSTEIRFFCHSIV